RLQYRRVDAQPGADLSPGGCVGVQRAAPPATTAGPGQADIARRHHIAGRTRMAGPRRSRHDDAARRRRHQGSGMSWPLRIGMGVAVLAALAARQAIDAALPIEHTDVRPFEHSAGVGERVHMAYADVTVDRVHTAKSLESPQGEVGTPG